MLDTKNEKIPSYPNFIQYWSKIIVSVSSNTYTYPSFFTQYVNNQLRELIKHKFVFPLASGNPEQWALIN